jgi:hypothetical protein
MITFACPHCRATINSPESQIGNNLECPACKASVPVPAGEKSRTGLIIALCTSAVILVLGCPMLIIVCLAAISVLGKSASGTFQSVGQTIGSGS